MARAENAANDLAHEIDDLLREYARSPLIDLPPEPEPERKARAQRLRDMQALIPGAWRARNAG
jgi:hypothetical protein